MNDKGEYVQISMFDILENQKQESYDRCDYCNMPCCYGCKYLEEDKDNGNS
jgi:hypothetical protein